MIVADINKTGITSVSGDVMIKEPSFTMLGKSSASVSMERKQKFLRTVNIYPS